MSGQRSRGRGGDRGGARGGAPRGGSFERGRGGGFDSTGGRGRGRGGSGAASGVQESLIFSPTDGVPTPSLEVAKAEDALILNRQGLSLEALSLKSASRMPLRPGYATQGDSIILRTNYFQVFPKPDLQLFTYHVDVAPEPNAARKWKRAFQLLISLAPFLVGVRPAVATDNRSMLVTLKKIDLGSEGSKECQVVYHEEEDDGPNPEKQTVYTFRITYTKALSVQELMDYLCSTDSMSRYDDKDSILQALNIAMSRKPSNSPGVAALTRANKFFPTAPILGRLGGGLVALRGYYASVRTSTLRLLVNVNAITASFYMEGPLAVMMREFCNSCKGNWPFQLHRFLKGVRVEVTHLKSKKGALKTKVLAGIAQKPPAANARQVSFMWDESKSQVTIEQYYLRKYNIRLSNPEAPIVNVGNAEHPCWMPAELCNVIPGQVARKKLSPEQTQEMIKVACRKPAANARLITGEGAHVLGLGSDHQDGPTLFGLKIQPQMLTVAGRILPAPTVNYATNRTVAPFSGSWNMINQKFVTGAAIKNWSYFKIQWADRDPLTTPLQQLMSEFKSMMGACGLRVEAPNPAPGFPVLKLNPADASSHFQSIDKWLGNVNNTSTKMLLVVLPARSQELYAHVKYLGDVRYGLHTVCSVASKLQSERGRPQYLANVALKWNLKQGGVNQQIPSNKLGILSSAKTMVVGIDVTHPSPGSREGAPSIAGVVASVDDKYAQWPAGIQCQEGRKEMVSQLEDMVLERLKLWQRKNKQALPQNILVYRDGVSEGQYGLVLEQESPALDRAIARIYPPKSPKPKVSIIIVGKRHHTRFYPTKEGDADRSGNPKNGTVVDRGITSERHWDFFLQAHTGLQGTARPAHYVVVQDQIGLGANGLEQLTHNLCYLFGRATKAVSICPPAYYADLVCERARFYLFDVFNDDSGSSTSSSVNRGLRWTSGVHPQLSESMFYI
ncbi:MAG: hypothetical protein M1833_007005 [Piccolia ochrophora]|nr:MAG: hypothetical protein M1833_007005 [Piccolia ochrophora]